MINKSENSNKKSNLLTQRIETPKPTSTFHTSHQLEKAKQKDKKIKTTTARLSFDSLHRVNALVTMGHADSFNDLLEIMLDSFENKLTAEEKNYRKLLSKCMIKNNTFSS